MKRYLIIALSVLLVQCAPNGGVLSIEKFFPLEASCGLPSNIKDSALVPSGSLDVSIFSPEFWVGFSVMQEATLQKEVSTGSTRLDEENRDKPLVTALVMSYRLVRNGKDVTPSALKAKKFTKPIVLPLNSDGRVYGALNLIHPAAAEALPSSLDVAETLLEGYDMFVALEFTGRMTRSMAPIGTGPVEFPIRVINRSPAPNCNRPQRTLGPCTFTGQGGWQTPPVPLRALTCCDPLSGPPIVGCDYTKP